MIKKAREENVGRLLKWITVIGAFSTLTACAWFGEQVRKDDEGNGEPEVSVTRRAVIFETAETRSECPQSDVVVGVEYVHVLHLKQSTATIKMLSSGDDHFKLTFRGDGRIDSQGFENRIPLGIEGDLDGCPLTGKASLTAEFTGTCSNGVVKMDIVEKLHDVLTTVTCPGKGSQQVETAGMFNTPQDHIRFELKGKQYAHELIMDSRALSFTYIWNIIFGWGIEPY